MSETRDSPAEKIGPYRIEERLGSGGMGAVYRAYDERLGRRVALKRIHPERAQKPRARERFLREARAAARLNHPALVQLHDVLENDDGDWIVMELVEGTPLTRLLKAGPLDPGCALVLAREVASGLAAAHAAGILHRDLKTENVVVTRDGHAKVLDFGLAKALEPDQDEATLTGDGDLAGTPRAMSPEQVRGRDLDHRSDLFSLGTLLYEMVAGRSPFLGPGPAATLARVCHHQQDPVREHAPEVPQELSELIDRLLAKEPAARPPSAAEVVDSLARIVAAASGAGEPSALPPATPEPAAAPAQHRRTAAEDGEEPFHLRGERRRLTVLCCELTGAALDPELLFEVLPTFQRLAGTAVERYEGHLRDLQGHRFVATFGYPRSHEDDARRAVLAALEVVTRSERTARGMVARAGVHTGPAVVLTRTADEHLAMGETLDLATVLQDQAEPGSVLASAATRRLVAGWFAEEATAPVRGPGLAAPIEACRVVAARDLHSRAAGASEPTPAVGLERQLGLLAGRFELAREGTGQAVLVAGEPGIGKTRLLRVFRDRFAAAPARWVAAHGSPYARNLPLHPVAGLVRRLLEIDPAAPAERQLARLGEVLGEHDLSPSETVPLFAMLLGLPTGGREVPALAELRRDTLAAVPALVLEMAERRPLVLAFEDLHQVDPMTLELISRLIDEAPAAPLLLLLTCRPGFRPPWGHRPHLTRLALAPLSAAEAGELIDGLAAERELPAAVRERILARADGVPRFVGELVRDALAHAVPASDLEPQETIPSPLCDALSALLDGLGAARELARIAAVLGREVSHDELAAFSALDQATLGHELARLLDAEILVEQDRRGAASYRFKRALVREAAAGSILAEDRQRLRRRIDALRLSPPSHLP